MPVHVVGLQSSLARSPSEYDDRGVSACSFTLPRTVVLPQVIALGASELSIFSTGLGLFRLEGGLGGEEDANEKGREKLAAKLEARPELARRKLLGLSGEVDKLWVWLSNCSELALVEMSGGVSPQEYEVEAGSLPQAPFDEPTDPYNPDGV